jgi:hypothetical protein
MEVVAELRYLILKTRLLISKQVGYTTDVQVSQEEID